METKQESTALTLPSQAQTQEKAEIVRSSAKATRLAAFTPGNLTEAIALSKMMANSELVPKDYRGKPANILVAIQFGSEIGLAPMQSLQSISVINGRPSIWGDAALALVQGHADFEDISETTEGTVAKCIVKRRGRSPVVRTFSDDDAIKAGLIAKGGVWVQYRSRMRQLRARGFALRDSFADVLKGISIAEESIDTPVDTSQAKVQRDSMTSDLSMLAPSQEQNRGHEDTGLGPKNGAVKKDEQNQERKPEPYLCSECRQTIQPEGSGHKSDCKFAAKAEQEKKTAQFQKALYLVLAADQKKKMKKGDKKGAQTGDSYLVLKVVTTTDKGDVEGLLYCWRTPLFEHLPVGQIDKKLVAEVSQQEKDGKKYVNLEHVLELAGVPFVNDAPAAQAQMPTQEEAEDNFAELFGSEER